MLRVLTYHRVADPAHSPSLHPKLVSATPEVFERHLDLLERGYTLVSLEQVVAAATGGRRLPRRAVLLTFDDAYRDFAALAWPMLRRRGLPAVMFVPTAYPANPQRGFWWDRLYRAFATTARTQVEIAGDPPLPLTSPDEKRRGLAALQARVKALAYDEGMALVDEAVEQLGGEVPAEPSVLSWDELRALARDGLALAAHTRNHPLLTRVTPARATDEARGSQADLQREIGAMLPVFAYPSGAHDDPSIEAVRAAGFTLAFTQRDGHNDLGRCELLALCRTSITRRTTAGFLRLRLQRWMTWVDRWRHRETHPARPAPAVPA